MLRDLLADDEELRRFRDEARRRQLPAAVRLPSPLSPAAFTQEALERLPERTSAPVWGIGIMNPWATWVARNIERRIAEILTQTFDQLRDGRLEAVGRALNNPGAVIGIPPDIWDSAATAVETATGNILISEMLAFVDVVVQQPAPPPRLASRSALDRFVAAFDSQMLAVGRRYVVDELVAAARQHLGAASAREVSAALRRASPAAWAGSGRRPARVVPSPDEIAQAARAETHA